MHRRPRVRARLALQNEQQENTRQEHTQWQTVRLVLAALMCLAIIGAAVVYERFG